MPTEKAALSYEEFRKVLLGKYPKNETMNELSITKKVEINEF